MSQELFWVDDKRRNRRDATAKKWINLSKVNVTLNVNDAGPQK